MQIGLVDNVHLYVRKRNLFDNVLELLDLLKLSPFRYLFFQLCFQPHVQPKLARLKPERQDLVFLLRL